MFREFLIFELKYRLRQPMVYAFLVLFLFLSHSFTVETNIGIGGFGNLNNVNVNSPFKILAINSLLSFIGILMATAFMSGAALRDFKHNFSQIVFTTPVEKFGYLFGRYCGAVIIMLIPFLGAILGSVTGTFLADPDKVGPFMFTAYFNSFHLLLTKYHFIRGTFLQHCHPQKESNFCFFQYNFPPLWLCVYHDTCPESGVAESGLFF